MGMWEEEERRFEKHTNDTFGRINYSHFLFWLYPTAPLAENLQYTEQVQVAWIFAAYFPV